MDLYTISALVFIAALLVIFYRDRKKVERQSIMLIRRTQKGKKSLIALGTRFPRFWNVVGVAGVIFGFVMSFYIVYLLLELIATNFLVGKVTPGLSLVLPSPSAEAAVVPGAILVPFWYWIIAIGLLVVVHEGMHGIMAAREKVRIKSMGWGLLAVIPLAFVEPDEKQLAKKPSWPQLRVFAAGSFANFMLAGLSLVLIASMSGLFVTGGVTYAGLIEDYPAAGVNLTGVIVGINGYEIRELGDLRDALAEIGENQTITITTIVDDEEREFVLQTRGEPEPVFRPSMYFLLLSSLENSLPGTIDYFMGTGNPETWTQAKWEISMWQWVGDNSPGLEKRAGERIDTIESEIGSFDRPGYIGISSVSTLVMLKPGLEGYTESVAFIQGLLFWLFLINFGVGAANLLPIGPLDGGRMWTIVFQRVAKKRWKGIMRVISYATLLILIINFAFWFGL